MVMRMKGHNGLAPCRMCNITGLRVPNSRATTNYVPLERAGHPAVRADREAVRRYDALALPLRTHSQIIQQGHEVDKADSEAHTERLSKAYGVKGISILSNLSSVSFPASFPYNFMHLIYENVLKNLILLWTNQYKGLDEGSDQDYHLRVWDAIGAATAATGSTVPAAFGARPRNVADDKATCTADMWSFWMLYIGPVLLAQQFKKRVYYDHFIEFVKLVTLCLLFEIWRDDITTIHTGFAVWVETYEKYMLNSLITII
ncbi:hypothetical protein FIBSPDRAFT_910310 [Athelia psychrophila]|uniref:Uncharacterized protein n=1 Tax=Athelia psychrophila TaxID=1759441 RepID=A0A166LM68_9AGAM|nr:hypothetical protein FIBSPDRAFT_910310 [Fibularhizoctonia sp. CBS 109695]